MRLLIRVIWIALFLLMTSAAWMVLAATMNARTSGQSGELYGKVADLWGESQSQSAPTLSFRWVTERVETDRVYDPETRKTVDRSRIVTEEHSAPAHLASSDLKVDLSLDQRRKGLLWFPLYNVDFDGAYTYEHHAAESGVLDLSFAFSDSNGLYDGFHLEVDGEAPLDLQPQGGAVRVSIPVKPGQTVALNIGYRSRGMTEWAYAPAQGVETLRDFSLRMHTDFAQIDFPTFSLSPTEKVRVADGWELSWVFDQVVTGHRVGMRMPENIQPGELAQEMAMSAPVSLFFFFLVLFVLSVLRGVDLHPVNYLLLSGAFFAFHLLFGYTADRLPVEAAFALSSVVSLVLVVSYLRLVVSDRFAFGPAAGAQLVYLVGFGLAHFWEGSTGLTVTVLSIVTLFLLMQLTGRIDWSAEFKKGRAS